MQLNNWKYFTLNLKIFYFETNRAFLYTLLCIINNFFYKRNYLFSINNSFFFERIQMYWLPFSVLPTVLLHKTLNQIFFYWVLLFLSIQNQYSCFGFKVVIPIGQYSILCFNVLKLFFLKFKKKKNCHFLMRSWINHLNYHK